jgi:hypothetical protein
MYQIDKVELHRRIFNINLRYSSRCIRNGEGVSPPSLKLRRTKGEGVRVLLLRRLADSEDEGRESGMNRELCSAISSFIPY